MIDSRFYEKKENITIKKISEILSAEISNISETSEDYIITKIIENISSIDNATESDITFLHNSKYYKTLEDSKAFACIVSKKDKDLVPSSMIAIIVDEPYLALSLLLKEFYSVKSSYLNSNYLKNETFISKNAVISKNAIIEEGCYISDYVIINDNCKIKKGTFIGSNTTILQGVEIGEDSYIEPNVTIGFAIIGSKAYIKTGARIGQQGFGFHIGKNGITDVLQVGRAIIGNNVQIGANSVVDRGSMSDTIIGNNVRIDNMVYIAHNVEVSDFCVIAGQTGIAGSTKIGQGCVFGGQVGISGHLKIGNRVTVAAQSGIMKDIEDNSKIAGSPTTNVTNWHRQNVILQKLVEKRNELELPKGFINKIKWLFK